MDTKIELNRKLTRTENKYSISTVTGTFPAFFFAVGKLSVVLFRAAAALKSDVYAVF